jgi:hypothetical protein
MLTNLKVLKQQDWTFWRNTKKERSEDKKICQIHGWQKKGRYVNGLLDQLVNMRSSSITVRWWWWWWFDKSHGNTEAYNTNNRLILCQFYLEYLQRFNILESIHINNSNNNNNNNNNKVSCSKSTVSAQKLYASTIFTKKILKKCDHLRK